jgi:hypothetical protein
MIFLGSERRLPNGEILPLDPVFSRWIDRINQGARFRLDFSDELFGAEGEPYLRLRLVPDGQDGNTFAELALCLYNRSVGALVSQSDGDVSPYSDHIPLSYGDIVDFLSTGELLDRVPCTPPWGYPDNFPDFPEGCLGPLYAPGLVVLPVGVRRNLAWLFDKIGAVDSGVSLFYAANGLQFLWFMYQVPHSLTEEDRQKIARRIFFYLPRHYAVLVVNTDKVKGQPVLPKVSQRTDNGAGD